MVTTAAAPSAGNPLGAKVFAFTSLSSLVGVSGDFLTSLPAGRRIAACQLLQSTFEAIKTEAATEFIPADGDTRAAEKALKDRKVSKGAARKTAARAAAAAKNPNITDKMKSGDLSGEQADAIVAADKRTGGAASGDDSLIDKVAAASAGQTGKVIDKYIADQADKDDVENEHQRQRALRDVRKIKTGTGLSGLMVEGDDPSIDAMYKQLVADAGRLYERDGGRETPLGRHARTHNHRMFDAVHGRITGTVSLDPTRDGAPVAAAVVDGDTRYTPPPSRRPTVVITVDASKVSGQNPAPLAEQIGVGPIPDAVLAQYLVDCDLVGAVFATNAEPLWLGRKKRHAGQAQFLALILRDKGCATCGAGYQKCQAHHLLPWHAPARGTTDIDNLALLCSECHHRLHEQKLTLFRDRKTGNWETRPAMAHETPPARPPAPQHRAAPEDPNRRALADTSADRLFATEPPDAPVTSSESSRGRPAA